MCVANIDMESEYPVVNGSLGIITKLVLFIKHKA